MVQRQHPKEAELRTVKVADIAEFPTELGSRCLLLQQFGLGPYWNTEEELLETLTETAAQPALLDICLQSSRCQKFYRAFREGYTPFCETDPIRLLEFRGRYWVTEGKHRVCLAKRAGVERLEAYVWPLPEDTESLLPPEGTPGRHVFRHMYPVDSGIGPDADGSVAVLWVKSPPGVPPSRFDFAPGALDARQDTGGELVTLFPGLSYRVSVTETIKKLGLFRRRKFLLVEAEVIIEPAHQKTKIWLSRLPAGEALSMRPAGLTSLETVYRFGCWRQRHFKLLSCISFGSF